MTTRRIMEVEKRYINVVETNASTRKVKRSMESSKTRTIFQTLLIGVMQGTLGHIFLIHMSM